MTTKTPKAAKPAAKKTTKPEAAKAAPKATATTMFPGFAAGNLKEAATETVAKLKAGLGDVTKRMGEAQGVAKDAVEALNAARIAANEGAVKINVTLLDFARANTVAGFETAKAVVEAKSVKEAMELQLGFVKQTFTTYMAQSKAIQALTVKTAKDAAAPIGATLQDVRAKFSQAA